MKYNYKGLITAMILSSVVFFIRTLIQGNFVLSWRFAKYCFMYSVFAGVIYSILNVVVVVMINYYTTKSTNKNIVGE